VSKGEEVVVDGSQGEGGGQILRSSLTLSMATGRPFRIERIRAGRQKPGLLRQHLTAVRAAAGICGAEVAGGESGSQALSFRPGPVRAGEYAFAVGTAGSAALVLQTILPALLGADGESRVTVEGGTHNPAAPPYEFLARSFAPALRRMGADVELRLVRHGFYPAGGGAIETAVRPWRNRAALELTERGALVAKRASVLLAHLPRHIGERELTVLGRRLSLAAEACAIEQVTTSPGPGNVVLVEVESEAVTEVFATFGEAGVRAEAVAEAAADQVRKYLAAGVAVGTHLADQLLLPMALGAGGRFKTLPLSRHAETNAEVIRQFTGEDISVTAGEDRTVTVVVAATGRARG
jgi:RNA 3'-terminal phosphate cyclase (ATP)